MLPLLGITVVSLEQAIAAPFATRQLADLGARVIKVERPDGGDFSRGYDDRVDGLSSHFVWCNRSKESIALDVKTPRGADALRRLVSRADVLVQNLAPGAVARLGYGFDDLAAEHPRLICCDISGYGRDGPDRDRKAYDLLIQAEAGFLSITGTPDEPVKSAISIADIAAGMHAFSAILAALIERERTGCGRRIDISMLECMAEWMGHPLYYGWNGAPPPPRTGATHASIYPYGPFPVADGEIVLGVQNEREWRAFCQNLLGRGELAEDIRFVDNAARSAHRDQLQPIIVAALAGYSVVQALAKLDDLGIANARLGSVADLWQHRQLAARHRWQKVGTEAGEIAALLPPGAETARMGPVPSLGADTDAILREIDLAE